MSPSHRVPTHVVIEARTRRTLVVGRVDGQVEPYSADSPATARVADERPWALTCRGCGCELDYGTPAHSPRCEA